MIKNTIFEICLDSAESCIAAEKGQAQRVELCDNLVEGGTTPSAGMIALARKNMEIDLNVIIRPRGGDFLYNELEFEVMKYDIETCKKLGVDGVVIGMLNSNGTIDRKRMQELTDLARPMSVTCHRAFDMTRDPFDALETLIEIGIDRILTSGQKATAIAGKKLLKTLVEKADERIIIMPACEITAENVKELIEYTGVKEVHVVGSEEIKSEMDFFNFRCFMGTDPDASEYNRKVTTAKAVNRIITALGE